MGKLLFLYFDISLWPVEDLHAVQTANDFTSFPIWTVDRDPPGRDISST